MFVTTWDRCSLRPFSNFHCGGFMPWQTLCGRIKSACMSPGVQLCLAIRKFGGWRSKRSPLPSWPAKNVPKETAFVGRSQLTLIGVYAQFVSNIVVIMETDALGETWDANGAIFMWLASASSMAKTERSWCAPSTTDRRTADLDRSHLVQVVATRRKKVHPGPTRGKHLPISTNQIPSLHSQNSRNIL